jgi:hypothetical protein
VGADDLRSRRDINGELKNCEDKEIEIVINDKSVCMRDECDRDDESGVSMTS